MEETGQEVEDRRNRSPNYVYDRKPIGQCPETQKSSESSPESKVVRDHTGDHNADKLIDF